MRAAPYCPGKTPPWYGQVHPGAVDQVDDRDAVAHRDFLRAEDLPDRLGPPGSGLHRGVVGDDDDLAPLDHADAGDDAGARRLAVVLVVGDQQAELEAGRAGVEQPRDALARRELSLLVHLGDARRAAALPQARGELRVLLAELPEAAVLGWRRRGHGRALHGSRCSAAQALMYR